MDRSALMSVGEKSLLDAILSDAFCHCPSMDLVALGTTDHQVQIYRLNGEEVYASSQNRGNLRVEGIRWKPNGHLLAVAWSDGSVKLVGAESTKVVHQFTTADTSGISCIGWATNVTKDLISVESEKRLRKWDDLLTDEAEGHETAIALDLPQSLSQIDIETSLPKLSVLASGGTSEDVFSSSASLDALFRPFDPKDTRSVDTMLVGTRNGMLHLSIYDSFIIGSFTSPIQDAGTTTHLALHAAHARYSTHSLLLKSPGEVSQLYFVPMDLRFVSASSEYLSLLASRSSALQNLLRYIHEVHRLMVSEWESTRDLPGKFLRNVDDDLQEKENRDIVQALYHSIATGHTFPIVKEWLVDQVAERGHKRWDKAVTSGLQNLKQLVHENMLPALDRCSVILSRFAGIAKFRGAHDSIGFTSQQINLITDTIAGLHLVSSKLLNQVIEELELFTAFSAWLRYEIDRLASESSSTQEEDADTESAIDHGKVLLYIQTALRTSPLANYLGRTTGEALSTGQKQVDQGAPLFDTLNKQVRKMEKGQQYLEYFPRQDYLTSILSAQASKVFSQIAEAEKRNVLFGDAMGLGSVNKDSVIDMRMARYDSTVCRTYIAVAPKERAGYLQIVRVTLFIEKGISSTRAVDSSSIQLGTGVIKHVKISEDSTLVLWSFNGETHLLSIPLENSTASTLPGGPFEMRYHPFQAGTDTSPVTLGNEHVKRLFKRYDVPPDDGGARFVPAQIHLRDDQASGRDGKGSGRIVLVGEDKLRYRVLAIAKGENEGKDGDGDVAMPESAGQLQSV